MHISDLLNPQAIISTVGVIGVICIVFAESGLFFGFFFPGDSLLFTAGFLASRGYLNLGVLLFGAFLAAAIGDSVGYSFGKKIGPTIFKKEDSFIWSKKRVEQAGAFYEKYGKKTIILARFVPIVRTFAPILAGVGKMDYKTFVKYNITGAFLWVFGITLLGYFLGNIIPNVDKYLLPIIALIILLSILPPIFHIIKARREKK
ncbi:MAG: DedA family protein [Candidatus Taylorbacteria bacterium]|nr:DedA family protein [Candidatus Taylorbacteria bacterium]